MLHVCFQNIERWKINQNLQINAYKGIEKKDTMSIWFLQFGNLTGVCQDAHQTQNTFY